MKTKRIIAVSALPALIASCFLSGCATQPVGELTTRQFSEESEPGMKRTQEVRRTIAPVTLDRRGACDTELTAEPVAERIYYRPAARRTIIRGAACDQPYVPYGPNSPVSPSQWY